MNRSVFKKKILMPIFMLMLSLSILCSCSDGADAVGDEEQSNYLTYEEYSALSGAEQKKYYETFDDVEAFFAWYNTALDKYNESIGKTENNGGDIDLGGKDAEDQEQLP